MNLRRKRLRLMRDTQWRGYARTAEGNPITLSQIRSVLSLSVLGNSSQDGTPSPDNSVEVVGTGTRTRNLWDRDFSDNDDNWVGTKGGYRYLNFDLKPNTKYTLFVKQNNMHKGYSDYWGKKEIAFYLGEIANNWSGNVIFGNTTTNNAIKTLYSFETTDVPYYFNLYISQGSMVTVKEVFDELLPGIMLVEGKYTADTLPLYEPYGYKVAVTAQGRNLFTALGRSISEVADSGPMGKRVFGDNVIIESISRNGYVASYNKIEYSVSDNIIDLYVSPGSGYGLGFDIDVFAGEQYNIRFTVLVGIADVSMSYYDADGVFISSTYKTSSTGTVFSSTVPDGAKKMILTFTETYGQTAHHIKLSDIMLVKDEYTASSMPSYEPYKPPQTFNVYSPEVLHGVGSAHDTVVLDFDKQKANIIKKYEYFKVDADKWYQAGDSYNGEITTDRYHNYNKYNGHLSTNDSKCNILPKYNGVIWVSDVQGFTFNTVQLHLRINNDILGITANDTTEERTAKFTAYTQNNDIYVLGKLISPVVSDITDLQNWDALQRLKGTWILTATGGTEPTLTAEYYSNERSTE